MIEQSELVSTISPANKFLWVVKTFIDLITREAPLVHGIGLKRLYATVHGADNLNEEDILNITCKAEKMKILPAGLDSFMMTCIMKNCNIYANELVNMINKRICMIANGEVSNPQASVSYNAVNGRRNYYLPTAQFLMRVRAAVNQDLSYTEQASTTFNEVAYDARMILVRMQGTEGHVTSSESSFGALSQMAACLRNVISDEAMYNDGRHYNIRAKGALTILWAITKMMYGDLSEAPQRKDINLIDLGNNINILDGTLASLPFPTRNTIGVFCDDPPCGMTLKGRFYLEAVSAIPFYSHECV